MLPTTFEGQNLVFGKPANMTDEQCFSLPAWKGVIPIDDKGTTVPAIISCWRLSKEDMEEIQKTGVVWLSVIGDSLPPVSVFTENPIP